jgi:hypothetical protein
MTSIFAYLQLHATALQHALSLSYCSSRIHQSLPVAHILQMAYEAEHTIKKLQAQSTLQFAESLGAMYYLTLNPRLLTGQSADTNALLIAIWNQVNALISNISLPICFWQQLSQTVFALGVDPSDVHL